jgi:hypothetical protein
LRWILNAVSKLETHLKSHYTVLKSLEHISTEGQDEKAHILQIKLQKEVILPINQAIFIIGIIVEVGLDNLPTFIRHRWGKLIEGATNLNPPKKELL